MHLSFPLVSNGFRLTVAKDGGLHGWDDFMVPSGDYDVTVLIQQEQVTGLRLHGPVVDSEPAEFETLVSIPQGSVFCLTDWRHVQPSLGPLLTAQSVAAELDGAFAKVVTPQWLGTATLLVGPTAFAYLGQWTADWCHGGRKATSLALDILED